MVIGVFYSHEIANSSPAGQDQTSSLLSNQALFIALLYPPCRDGEQPNLIFHEVLKTLTSDHVWQERVHRYSLCLFDDSLDEP